MYFAVTQNEIILYIALAGVCSSLRYIISGLKNGAFYAKGAHQIHPFIDRFVKNLHKAETMAWYAQSGIFFFMLIALARMYGNPFPRALGWSFVVTMAFSGMAGVFRQGFINWGSGEPFVNPKEIRISEFALPFKIGKFEGFWWSRPWSGRGRIVFALIAAPLAALGIIMMVKEYDQTLLELLFRK